MTSSNTMSSAAIIFTISLESASIFTFEIAVATNRLIPYGGVQKPIARFHQLIVDKSNNNYIKNLVRVLAAQIRRYQAVAYSLTDTFEESAGQHLGILQKIEERNLDEARELLRAHIEWSYKELAAVML